MHGAHITSILCRIVRDPEYSFFQIADEYGDYDDRDLIKAIVWAADYGVDLLNLSLGSDHILDNKKDCDHTGPKCAVAEAVEYAAEEQGVTVISAVGNRSESELACCPAISEHTIAVGGSIAKCTASGEESNQTINTKPSGSFWVNRADGEGLSGTFCSNKGCSPGESCDDNRSVESWEGNPQFLAGTPDTLAPVNYPLDSGTGPIMRAGTSFSVPIVSAAIANILEGFDQDVGAVSPSTIRKYIRVTGEPVDGVPVGNLNSLRLAKELMEEKGLDSRALQQQGTNEFSS